MVVDCTRPLSCRCSAVRMRSSRSRESPCTVRAPRSESWGSETRRAPGDASVSRGAAAARIRSARLTVTSCPSLSSGKYLHSTGRKPSEISLHRQWKLQTSEPDVTIDILMIIFIHHEHRSKNTKKENNKYDIQVGIDLITYSFFSWSDKVAKSLESCFLCQN